jgi:hypothetical protein
MSKVCSHCGTEVEDEALFCPACGQPFAEEQAAELPNAPDWPEAPLGSAAPAPMSESTPSRAERSKPQADSEGPASAEPAMAEPPESLPPLPAPGVPYIAPPPPAPGAASAEVPPWRRGVAARAPASRSEEAAEPGAPPAATTQPASPRAPSGVATPATLAGWLLGMGSVVGALALFLPWVQGVGYTELWGLATTPNLLLLILLVAVAVSVFLPGVIPAFAQRSLAIMAVTLIGVGIGLDAVARPASATGALIFLLGLIAAAVGTLLPDLGLDRRVGRPAA